MARTLGSTQPFPARPWPDIAEFFRSIADAHEQFARMSELVGTIIECGGASKLAGFTSMHDLVVTPLPVAPIYDVVRVSPESPGAVVIEHRAVTGRNDRITRPTADVIPLFWRFMTEKYGIEPAHGISAQITE
jgi:hypothetical protein